MEIHIKETHLAVMHIMTGTAHSKLMLEKYFFTSSTDPEEANE
jgi:hypothetical protein